MASRRLGIFGSLLVLGTLLPVTAEAAVWSNAGFAAPPRFGHVAERLPDGRVLVAGGSWDAGDGNLSSAVIFDPKMLTWSPTAPMTEGRAQACSAVLKDGRVLVAGGTKRVLDGTLGSSEIYSASAGTWSAVGGMKFPRYWAACITLPDGRVLAAGGAPTADTDSADAETFDPSTGTWSAAPSMPFASHNPRAALLSSGRVVLVGGSAITEFDTASNAWLPTVALSAPARVAISVLTDGKVLIVGEGSPNSVIYDPGSRTVTPTGPLKEKGRGASQLVTLTDGRVLAVGGLDAASKRLATAEIFDPKTKTWTLTDSLPDGNVLHTVTPLLDGRVLVVGDGTTHSMPAQIFNAVDGTSCLRNEDCTSGYCTDGVCCDSPCGGACAACDLKDRKGVCSAISGSPKAGHSSCAPYAACASGACVAGCSSDADCSAGNVCYPELNRCGPDKNLCGPNDSVIDRKSGEAKPCAPFACSLLGTCNTSCATSLDCAAGFVCEAPACVPAPNRAADGDAGGCGISAGPAAAWPAVALLVAAAGMLRRRWGRRRSMLLAAMLGAASLGTACTAGDDLSGEQPAHARSALEWSAGGAMQTPVRVYHTATVLSDGRVLVAGGGGASVLSTAELFDPAQEKWARAASMKRAHAGHDATLLADGRVLVTGGRDATGKQLSSAEIYDPSTNSWSEAPMSSPRETHLSVRLSDGRVLVAGGVRAEGAPVLSAEILDPATNSWAATGSLSGKRVLPAAHLLEDGRVIVAGGEGNAKTTETFDPATGTWASSSPLPSESVGGSFVRVGKGRLVLVGGTAKTALVLDESTMSWRAAAPTPPREDGAAVLLTNGQVALFGGQDGSSVFDTYVTYDPQADVWSSPSRMTVPRWAHTASVLGTGRVLVVGGLGTLTRDIPLIAPPEILNLVDGSTCSKDAECSTGFCVDGRCCNRWCAGACEACDLPGKEGTCSPVTGTPRPAREGVGPRRPSCSPYGACIEGACATSCASDNYCDESHVCDAATASCVEPVATCDGASTVTDKITGATKSCAPYRCKANGSCPTKCSSSDECAMGAVCDGNSCVVPVSDDDAGGCSTTHGGRSGASAGLFGCVFAAAWVRRRRLTRAR